MKNVNNKIEKGKLPMSLGKPQKGKIRIRRGALPKTVVKPTAPSHSGVDVGLEFFLTPAITPVF